MFDTFGAGLDGSFAGIEFLGGFDRIVISSAIVVNGAFIIDNLRFDTAAVSVPEPATLALLGLGLAGIVGFRRRV